jgi:hypothetical protein
MSSGRLHDPHVLLNVAGSEQSPDSAVQVCEGFICKGSILIKSRMTPRVDVMITIFCDFCQFSAEKNGVFDKNQCYDHFF